MRIKIAIGSIIAAAGVAEIFDTAGIKTFLDTFGRVQVIGWLYQHFMEHTVAWSLLVVGVVIILMDLRQKTEGSVEQLQPPNSPMTDALIVDARTVFDGLSPAQKQVVRIVYAHPGLTFADVSSRLESQGFADPKDVVTALFRTNLVHRTDGGKIYPGASPVVALEIEALLAKAFA